jgi:hypothetical protein
VTALPRKSRPRHTFVLAGGPFGSEVLSTSRARQWGVPIERRNGLIPAKTSQRDVKIGMAGCAEKPRGRGETGTLTKMDWCCPEVELNRTLPVLRRQADRATRYSERTSWRCPEYDWFYTATGATQGSAVQTKLRCKGPEKRDSVQRRSTLSYIQETRSKAKVGLWMRRLIVSDTICIHFGYSVCVCTQIVTSSRRVID